MIAAIALGVLFGWLAPEYADQDWVRALGDGFVKLIKMTIAPIIFCTVTTGVAHIDDAKKVGRVGVKALIYFEIVSTFALAAGLIVGQLVRPGAGFPGGPDAAAVAQYTGKAAEHQSPVDLLLGLIPDTIVGAFAQGDILQVLLFSILFGFSLMAAGERVHRLRAFVSSAASVVSTLIAERRRKSAKLIDDLGQPLGARIQIRGAPVAAQSREVLDSLPPKMSEGSVARGMPNPKRDVWPRASRGHRFGHTVPAGRTKSAASTPRKDSNSTTSALSLARTWFIGLAKDGRGTNGIPKIRL